MPTDEGDGSSDRIIRLYTGYQFFFSLLIWLPIFYEFQRRIGLTDGQIFDIQSLYYVVFCFLEIPTGMLADQVGRRRCMRLAALSLVVANILPIAFPGYHGFLYHFLLIALARSFNSGASAAYLYDFLESRGETHRFKDIEGRARALGLYGKVFCWSGVGMLMAYHLTLPYWLTVFTSLAALVYAMVIPDVEARAVSGDAGLMSRLGDAFRALLRTPLLVIIMLQGVAVFVLARICQVNLFQPILGAKQFDLATYGLVMSAMTLFEAFGSQRPGWMRRWFADLDAVYVLSIMLALTFLGLPWAGKAGTVALLCLFALACGLSYPIQRQLLNDHIDDSRYRATLMSVESIIDRAVCAVLAAQIGSSLEGGMLDRYLLISAGLTFGGMVVLWIVTSVKRGAAPADHPREFEPMP